jgi:3-deoxy-manno-octulosonate cytidylyltransferase (CMP-KDO synthetase)
MNSPSFPAALVVIPARLDSVRLARKMLLRVEGRTILEHTFRGARSATLPRRVVVATPDKEIADEVERFGGEVIWTSREAPSGTDRVAEASAKLPEYDLVVNVQGDEPQIPGSYIDEVLSGLVADETCPVSTLAAPLDHEPEIGSPACVKVVVNALGRALYFSRNPIPHVRDAPLGYAAAPGRYWRHLGIYAYRREFLANLAQIQPSLLEQSERLEQLRWLEGGIGISVRKVPRGTRGIDTAEDLQAFEANLHRSA